MPATRSEPSASSRALRIFAWISFILNVAIIATGGTVRLTGSGLGCSDWPVCTPGSLVPTPELGIHGVIEFANRTISGPLLLAALIVVILTWRIRRARRDLWWLSLLISILIVVQAIVGAFVVWEELAAILVGFHYTASLVIVSLAAAFLSRAYETPGPRVRSTPRVFTVLTHLTTLLFAVTVFVGVLTTAAGPHSGDAAVIREGVDASLLAHIHSWPAYALELLALLLLIWAAVSRLRPARWLVALNIGLLIQIGVGVLQSRTGLPPVAVGVHMVLAALLSAAMVLVVLRLRQPITAA